MNSDNISRQAQAAAAGIIGQMYCLEQLPERGFSDKDSLRQRLVTSPIKTMRGLAILDSICGEIVFENSKERETSFLCIAPAKLICQQTVLYWGWIIEDIKKIFVPPFFGDLVPNETAQIIQNYFTRFLIGHQIFLANDDTNNDKRTILDGLNCSECTIKTQNIIFGDKIAPETQIAFLLRVSDTCKGGFGNK
jgi:hypothetical protein